MYISENVILSIYLNTRGFGYAVLDMPETLIDYAVVTSRPINNDVLMERISKIIEDTNPKTIVIRDSESNKQFKCCQRIQELTKQVVKVAEERQVQVYKYTRQQIRDTFEMKAAETKVEIAKQIAVWFEDLAPRLPKARKPWTEEDYNMGIFDAMALAITHCYLQ